MHVLYSLVAFTAVGKEAGNLLTVKEKRLFRLNLVTSVSFLYDIIKYSGVFVCEP